MLIRAAARSARVWPNQIGTTWHRGSGLRGIPSGTGKRACGLDTRFSDDAPSLFSANNMNYVARFSYSVQFNDGLLDNPYLGRESQYRYPLANFSADTPFPSPLWKLSPRWTICHCSNSKLELDAGTGSACEHPTARGIRGYARSTHLKGEYDQNAPIYDPSLTLAENRATIDARRPLQGSNHRPVVPWTDANHSLQVSIQQAIQRRIYHSCLVYVVEGNGLPIDQPGSGGCGAIKSL